MGKLHLEIKLGVEMSKQKDTEKRDNAVQGKKITDEERMRLYLLFIGKLHEGISQLSDEGQDTMIRKHNEASIEGAMLALSRITSRDPKTFSVDEMIKNHEQIEKQFSDEKASITREDNIITWKSNLSYCYDPKIEQGWIKPYPAYCRQCNQYFFEGLYGIAHKGPVKVEGLKGVLKGDDECLTRVELL